MSGWTPDAAAQINVATFSYTIFMIVKLPHKMCGERQLRRKRLAAARPTSPPNKFLDGSYWGRAAAQHFAAACPLDRTGPDWTGSLARGHVPPPPNKVSVIAQSPYIGLSQLQFYLHTLP